MPSIRMIVGLPVAGVITAALFLVMRALIAPPEEGPQKGEAGTKIDITRPERDESTNLRDRNRPDRPQQQDQPPPPPPMQLDTNLRNVNSNLTMNMPAFDGEIGMSFSAPSDRTATPIVRIPPQYPERAAQRGIEGWVLIEFTITSAGTVSDAVVVDADPQNVFNRSAIKAIQRWKYRPKIVDGKPSPQYQMQQKITYELLE